MSQGHENIPVYSDRLGGTYGVSSLKDQGCQCMTIYIMSTRSHKVQISGFI